MDERLEEFMRELSGQMQDLPAEERERRLAEASKRLETLVAANISGGADEETALTEAIRKYREENPPAATAAVAAAAQPMRDLTDRLRSLPPAVVTALYCAAGYNAVRYAKWVLLSALVHDDGLSQSGGWSIHALILWCLPPSFLISAAAVAAIVCRDGIVGARSAIRDRTTITGLAVRWIALNEAMHTALWALILLIARDVESSGTLFTAEPDPVRTLILLVLLALTLTCPFIAGCCVANQARGAAFSGLDAVKIAASTAFGLTLTDQLLISLGLIGHVDFLQLLAFTIVSVIVKAMFFSLGIAGAAVGTSLPTMRSE